MKIIILHYLTVLFGTFRSRESHAVDLKRCTCKPHTCHLILLIKSNELVPYFFLHRKAVHSLID